MSIESGEWRTECLEWARILGAPDEVIERIEQYASDEETYDDADWPDPLQFVRDEMECMEEYASDEEG